LLITHPVFVLLTSTARPSTASACSCSTLRALRSFSLVTRTASPNRLTVRQAMVPALCLRPRIRLWFTDISHAGGRAGALGMKVAGLVFGIATAVSVMSLPVHADPLGLRGAYVGLNAGAAWGSSNYATDPGCLANTFVTFCDSGGGSTANGTAVANSGTGELSSTGVTGGIQGGYNWQLGNFVFGGEGDFGAFDLSESASPSGAFPVTFLGDTYSLRESMSTKWLATLRGRLGVLVAPHLLLYGTGGLALTDFKFSSSYSDNAVGFGFPGGKGRGSESGVRVGWTVGGGGEWFLRGGWSLKAEYLYVDFGSESIAVPTSNTSAYTQTMHVDADLSASLARLGLNYRF
jgi:outer membrane immunogenic protein